MTNGKRWIPSRMSANFPSMGWKSSHASTPLMECDSLRNILKNGVALFLMLKSLWIKTPS